MLRPKLGVALLIIIGISVIALPIAALSCTWPAKVEVWELELIAVTIDGEPAELHDRYDDMTLTWYSGIYSEGMYFDYTISEDANPLGFLYSRQSMPEDFEPFVADQGERQ
ncbi:hypothetical protein EA187_09190 [Lujinxingia sediminis]|uniref:Uncharacterized protein n=1 Tax=Lujinxingia sediminis TaxID=2480984 RepID=A0ABY0CTC8_9DELT|nr:hypothetical protein [Lujinxingia sediminis]RVU44707.1 hypothetical protein EA187_09190 [Lujinxingia sediminis]